MMLEAVWFKNGKEVYRVSPVVNIVCYEDMKNIDEIEIEDGNKWHSCEENKFDADDFMIRIKDEQREEDCRECRHFLGCECFDGMTCNKFEKKNTK